MIPGDTGRQWALLVCYLSKNHHGYVRDQQMPPQIASYRINIRRTDVHEPIGFEVAIHMWAGRMYYLERMEIPTTQ